MPELAKAYVTVVADNTRLRAGLDQSQSMIRGFGRSARRMLGAVGVGFGAYGLVRGVKQMAVLAMHAQETENLFRVSMGKMEESTRKWSEEFRESVGMNAFAVRHQVGVFNTMFKAMGMGADEARDLSTQMTELAYDLSSFRDEPVDVAINKIKAGLVGMSRPMRDWGYIISENAVKLHAATMGIGEYGRELTYLEKVHVRGNLIMKVTTDAQGDLKRTLHQTTNQLRIARANWEQFRIELGTELLPIITRVTKGLNEMMTDPETRKTGVAVVEAAVNVAEETLDAAKKPKTGRFLRETIEEAGLIVQGGIRNIGDIIEEGPVAATGKWARGEYLPSEIVKRNVPIVAPGREFETERYDMTRRLVQNFMDARLMREAKTPGAPGVMGPPYPPPAYYQKPEYGLYESFKRNPTVQATERYLRDSLGYILGQGGMPSGMSNSWDWQKRSALANEAIEEHTRAPQAVLK